MGYVEIANRLIKKFGQPAELLTYDNTVPDGGGGYEDGPATTHPVTICVSDWDQDLGPVERGGEVTDIRVFLSIDGLAVEPSTYAELKFGGDTYRIRYLKPLAPDGTTVFWELQVHRG